MTLRAAKPERSPKKAMTIRLEDSAWDHLNQLRTALQERGKSSVSFNKTIASALAIALEQVKVKA